MATVKKKVNFFESAAGVDAKAALDAMTADAHYNTPTSYSASAANLSDNQISFTRKHMLYLSKHSDLNPKHYIANLRLITKLRD